jgi:hypothetical protein
MGKTSFFIPFQTGLSQEPISKIYDHLITILDWARIQLGLCFGAAPAPGILPEPVCEGAAPQMGWRKVKPGGKLNP